MNRQIFDFFSAEDLFQIHYGDAGHPREILGRHLVKGGQIINAYHPSARTITVVNRENGDLYKMENVQKMNVFSAFIPSAKKFPYVYLYEMEDGSTRIIADAYSLPVQLDQEELARFEDRLTDHIYENLGAHPMKVEEVEGTLFAVWAPGANRVSVIGEFNHWDSRIYTMEKRTEKGIFELFIPDVGVGDVYQFELKAPSGRLYRKTDPYGYQQEIRPGKASIVTDLNQHVWKDQKWEKQNRADLGYHQPISIYEVHFGSWRRHEDGSFYSYGELADELADYVVDMGYTHVEILGIAEHPYDRSWGYQVTGYYAPTSRFGTTEEFMKFIDIMHEKGIGVIIDWVPAHFPKDSNGLADFTGTNCYEPDDENRREHKEWGTLAFDYGKQEVINFLVSNALFWVEKFHLDGLRVDAVASMLYLDFGSNYGQYTPNYYGGNENLEAAAFLRQLNRSMKKQHPEVMIFAEESTAWTGVTTPVANGGLGFSYKWNMGWMHDFLTYMSAEPANRKWHYHKLIDTIVRNYAERYVLVLSHDEVVYGKGSMIQKMPGTYFTRFSNLRLAYGLMFAHPGKKLLFMGQDFAQWEEWNENKALSWDLLQYDEHAKMQTYIRALLYFYKNQKALYELDGEFEGFSWINASDIEGESLSFVRKTISGLHNLLIVCNFADNAKIDFRVGVPCKGNYQEVFSNQYSEYGGIGFLSNGKKSAEPIEWDDQEFSIQIQVPPLGILMFEYDDGLS